MNTEFGEEAAKFIQSQAMEKVTEAIVVDQQGDRLRIVLFPKGEKDWNKSINCQLLERSLAQMERFEEDDEAPEEINDWFDIEEEQRELQNKIWQYGGADDDDQ